MKLTFIGTGYVGLVTGTCMAELGHTVICADVDKKKIAKLKRGVMPIYELGLEELVEKNVKEGRLSFTTSIGKAIKEAEVVFNAVGTPEDKKTGKADMRYVYAVAETFGKNLNGYKILVNKSTVPVGTADKCRDIVLHVGKGKLARNVSRNNAGGLEFDIVSNPEFLREGAAIKDFLNPDRVVVGVSSDRAKEVMEKIYRPIARAGRPVMVTDIRSAELIKYASNAFLATKIAFINEIANFCEKAGANVKEVARGMGADNRIGSRFLYAGIGYGGSCFPKDVQALIETGKEYEHCFSIIEAADTMNDVQKLRPIEFLKKQFENLKGKTIAIWGLSFKPRTDDVREAPALYVIEALLKAGARVRVFDPVAMENFQKAFPDRRIQYVTHAYEAVEDAHALVVMTEWDEFRTVEYPELASRMKHRVIVDGRNIFERREAEKEGFVYFGIGV
ncbi:MAG: UDP-glucose/GDP-mannose dehydrogenase family protein [Candidatus Moranbacteria bacterium]|nr:UDP-glucose/GDP-mannose dehydrogenase family protein [Candidatus Moranbacteria bacterium]